MYGADTIVALAGAGWVVYKKLPNNGPSTSASTSGQTILQIVMQPPHDIGDTSIDIPIEISPVDILAVRHEFFAAINSFGGQPGVDGACIVTAPSSRPATVFDFSAA